MKSTASAVWTGTLKEGQGEISSESGVLQEAPYTFKTRFEGEHGTNPEELIGAAHAGCFSMALSNILGQAGFTPGRVATEAEVTLDMTEGGPTISRIHLTVVAHVPGATAEAFQEAAEKAKAGCPVSKVLNADITMDAKLAG